jgi:hypothetical protein
MGVPGDKIQMLNLIVIEPDPIGHGSEEKLTRLAAHGGRV